MISWRKLTQSWSSSILTHSLRSISRKLLNKKAEVWKLCTMVRFWVRNISKWGRRATLAPDGCRLFQNKVWNYIAGCWKFILIGRINPIGMYPWEFGQIRQRCWISTDAAICFGDDSKRIFPQPDNQRESQSYKRWSTGVYLCFLKFTCRCSGALVMEAIPLWLGRHHVCGCCSSHLLDECINFWF